MSDTTAGSQYDRLFIRWGQGREMNAFEAAMWHVSDRNMLRASSVVVELLDYTPPFDRLVTGHAWALGRVPRLRQRVVSDPVRLGPPAWADSQVDLTHHVRRITLAPGSTFDDVLAIAAELHEEEFEPGRPLWVAQLVEGLADGQCAYVLKFHHAMADDLALVALFELLHSYVRKPTVSAARHLPPPVHEECTPSQLATRHALGVVHRAPVAAVRTLAGIARGVTSVRDPGAVANRSADTVRAARHMLATTRWSGSHALAARGPHRAFDALDMPVERLREAGAASGGHAADVALATTVDGLSRYLEAIGQPVTELPVAVPLRIRLDGSGDRLPRARILVPAGPMESSERIAQMARLIAEAERPPHIDMVRSAAPLLSRAPKAVVGPMLERANQPLALQGFVVPGLSRDAYLAGGQVLKMFSFAPTGGCALSLTLLSHQETSCLAFNFDTAAITEPDTLKRCLREAFAELP